MSGTDLVEAHIRAIIGDPELRAIFASGVAASLTDSGLEELFFICAGIDDPNDTDGVRVEVNYAANGGVSSINFFVHSFNVLDSSAFGPELPAIVARAWDSPYTSAAYMEYPDDDEPYDVLPFGFEFDESNPVSLLVQAIFTSAELRSVLVQSLTQTKTASAGRTQLKEYSLAVLRNLGP